MLALLGKIMAATLSVLVLILAAELAIVFDVGGWPRVVFLTGLTAYCAVTIRLAWAARLWA